MVVITEYPAVFILLCIISGAGYAAILYFHDLKKRSEPLLNWSLAALRFLSVFLIAFLLLSPLLKKSDRILEKPAVIIGIDNSESMVLSHDSTFCTRLLPKILDTLIRDLDDRFNVNIYSFGNRLSSGFKPHFREQGSDISLFFNEFDNRYSNLNAAALILITDGIYNKGTDPFYTARKIMFPIYTVGIGDTSLKTDGAIRKVKVNKVVFKNDQFTAEALVDLIGYQGSIVKIRLNQGTKTLDTREISAPSRISTRKIPFTLEAKEKGFFKYTVFLDPLPGEENKDNNRYDFYVEVRESRKQVAIVTSMKHPDINAMKSALEGTSSYEITTLDPEGYRSTTRKFNLVILYQLPSITGIANMNMVAKSTDPLLCVLGTQTDINGFNQLNTGFIINGFKNSFSDALPVVNESFSLFTLDRNDFQIFSNFPPLIAPFGIYQNSPVAEVLFHQKISNVLTGSPLILISRTPDRKIGIIAGENLWRWRISSYIQSKSHEPFDILFEKIVNYLTGIDDKELFKVSVKKRIQETEPVELEAEVRNASLELINDPDVTLEILDSAKHSFPFTFGKTQKGYYLNAGTFPPGTYRYTATVKVGGDLRKAAGEFFIDRTRVERMNLVADHNLLRRISLSHDAEMVTHSGMSALTEKIKNRQDLKTIFYQQVRMKDVIGDPWLFLVILSLLTLEWIIRKREGR